MVLCCVPVPIYFVRSNAMFVVAQNYAVNGKLLLFGRVVLTWSPMIPWNFRFLRFCSSIPAAFWKATWFLAHSVVSHCVGCSSFVYHNCVRWHYQGLVRTCPRVLQFIVAGYFYIVCCIGVSTAKRFTNRNPPKVINLTFIRYFRVINLFILLFFFCVGAHLFLLLE